MVEFLFDEKRHEYTLNGHMLTSVSKFIEHFTQPFDKELWSLYTAIRNKLDMDKKEFSTYLVRNYGYNFKGDRDENLKFLHVLADRLGGVDVYEIQKEWKDGNIASQIKGTNFHNMKENKVIADGGTKVEGEYFKHYRIPDLTNLNKDVPAVYTELRMFNAEFGLAGTSDKVLVWPNKEFYILDYKTNREIKMENKWQKMKPPISHMDDTNYSHYVLQLSTYAWMLEQFGYRCKGTKFIHYDIDETGKPGQETEYIFKPRFKEVKNMLKEFKNGSSNSL